jgi:hypothetical protein
LGDPYDGVQLSYDAGRRNLYLTPEGRCAWHSCLRRRSKGTSTSGRDHTRTRWTNARAVSATSPAAVDDVRDSRELEAALDIAACQQRRAAATPHLARASSRSSARNVTESSAFFDRKLTAPLGTLPRPSGPTRAQSAPPWLTTGWRTRDLLGDRLPGDRRRIPNGCWSTAHLPTAISKLLADRSVNFLVDEVDDSSSRRFVADALSMVQHARSL